jgi:hypothetical protein
MVPGLSGPALHMMDMWTPASEKLSASPPYPFPHKYYMSEVGLQEESLSHCKLNRGLVQRMTLVCYSLQQPPEMSTPQ